MNLEQIKAMVSETVKTAVGPIVTEALKPLQERQASYEQKLLSGGHRGDTPASEKGLTCARVALAIASFKGKVGPAIDYAKKVWGADSLAVKAMSTTNFEAGGAWLKPEYVEDFIELLDAKVVVTSFNPIISRSDVPTTWSKTTGGSTAAYTSENANLVVSEMATGDVTATSRELGAIVPISNKLVRATRGNADAIVRREMLKRVALRSDLAFIRGTGLQDTPKGLLTWCTAGNKFNATQAGANATLDEVTKDLGKAWLNLADKNVPMSNVGWIWAPRITEYLRNLRDGVGSFVYRDELNAGRFRGVPFRETTQIPTNLGGGSNESEVYLADFDEVVVQTSPEVMVEASGDASYTDQAGVTHSAFQKNQTLIRVTTANDLVLRHDLAVSVIQAVKWGA